MRSYYQFVIRGGDWFNYVPSRVRAGLRVRYAMMIRDSYVGFRCVRE
jgi:formylglycine-generating enzyme required for sulfatase activity